MRHERDAAQSGQPGDVFGIVGTRVDDDHLVASGARSTQVLVPSSVSGPGLWHSRTEADSVTGRSAP